MSVLLLYPSESPRSHTFTHSHTLAASNPDGWLHRSAWVSFMIPGSPTSLARHQPATQANTSLSLSHTHTQSRSVPLLPLQHIQRPQRDHKSTRTSRTGSPHPRRPRIAAGDGALRRNCTGTTGEEFQQLFLLDLKIKELPEAGDPSSLSFHDVWGAAIQRGENERLRGGQRGQPDVL